MEASAVRRPRLRGSLAAEAVTGSRIGRGFWNPIDAMLREASEIGTFCGRTLLELRGVWRYAAEVLRQCGILITGSALIVCFMAAMMGVVCGYESNYVLRGYGATVYSGVFTSYCGREMIPYMFGYIFAAKIGTG